MNQRLQRFAWIGEVIGAVGVIVSLVFVGLELRQSNLLAASESLREGTQYWLQAYDESIGSEESTAFWRRGLNDYVGLSKDEKGRFYATFFRYVGAFDTLHDQYEAGLLREETYRSIARSYYSLVKMPGVQQMMREMEIYLAPHLLDPAHNEALSGLEDDLAPWPFLEQ